jgi:hypothetical protein
MKLPQIGGCQFGKVRYVITEEPQSVYTCHCLDCQRLTGSAFSLGMVVPEKGFRVTGLQLHQLQRTADSGRLNTRLVCPDCGEEEQGVPRPNAAIHPARHYTITAAGFCRGSIKRRFEPNGLEIGSDLLCNRGYGIGVASFYAPVQL